ncbi:hypothetical protein EX895_005913 [Sporisorium graminicola]|uniref:Fms interacting protein n=1 Tax=Sporisorium graminicola TaxID=280036 RepID=A0A4U7KLJ1_9BASI|nr:hypothetical protein EX895_005913 [Sporisorium graminicola]TKY84833.1 hypothetical protein EX895_005913 [Sporisorium graminicola]
MSSTTEEELKQALASLSELSDLKTAIEDEADDIAAQEAREAAIRLLTASTPLFSTLKRLNRCIHTDLQAQKTNVAEERAKVDTARLALQNLKYEESMLELEVKVCQEFQSIFQDIELHDLQEFHRLRSTATTAEAKEKKEDSGWVSEGPAEAEEDGDLDDDHKLMLARLRFELKERKRLESEKQTLQQDKTQVVKQNKDKKVKLEQAEKQLKDLLAAAQAVQAKFESF